MYNPPANSTYTQSLQDDIFDLIENDLAKYSEKGNILIMSVQFIFIINEIWQWSERSGKKLCTEKDFTFGNKHSDTQV
jgi:hypothetical protein